MDINTFDNLRRLIKAQTVKRTDWFQGFKYTDIDGNVYVKRFDIFIEYIIYQGEVWRKLNGEITKVERRV